MSENRCVCCNAIIPEGRQVCKRCEVGTDNNVGSMNDLIADMRREYSEYLKLGYPISLARSYMIDCGFNYCKSKKYEISLIAFAELVNEISVKESRA